MCILMKWNVTPHLGDFGGRVGIYRYYNILRDLWNKSLFFILSGIAPCVGTAGTVHDAYT